MTAVLTQFIKSPLAPVDFAEKAADFCLLPLRLACGKWVSVRQIASGGNDYSPNTNPNYVCNCALIDYIGRFFIALGAFSIALPLTVAGAIFALCSSTHQNSMREYAAAQNGLRRPPPPPSSQQQTDSASRVKAMLLQGLEETDHLLDDGAESNEILRHQTLKRVIAQATLTREQAQEIRRKTSEALGPLPEDFENTLGKILTQGSLNIKDAIANNPILSVKIQTDRIAARIIALAPQADAQNLPQYATALYFLDRSLMARFLKALGPDGTEIAALAVSPCQGQNNVVFIRDLFAEAIVSMVQAEGQGVTDRTYASMFLAVCDPDWVVNAFAPEVWSACAEGYSGSSQFEPLGVLTHHAKQKYYSPDSDRNPIEQFFQKLFFDQCVYILQLANEQNLPMLMNGDEAEQPLLTAVLGSCSVQRIRTAFGDSAYRQKLLDSQYMKHKAPVALWQKFGQAFPS